MLRSFDYAAWAAALEASESRGRDPAASWALLGEWRDLASAAFLEGYDAAAGAGARDLLDLFLLEKALYEVRYELAQRPTWLRIPLQGVAALLLRP